MLRSLIVVAVLTLCADAAATPPAAGRVQGADTANTAATGNPVAVGMTDAGGKVQRVSATNPLPVVGTVTATPSGTALVNPAPQTAMVVTEQCVTNVGGGTTVSIPANTILLQLQNLGPNPVTCTFSGTTPVANTTGWLLGGYGAGATDVPDQTPALPMKSSTVTLKCIAKTAAQSTGACLQMLSWQ